MRMKTIKKIVILSDLQVPYEDEHVVKNVAQFLKTFKPDQTVTIGDEIDFQTISKWSDGTPSAYEQTLGDDRDRCVEVLWRLGVTDCIRSNHTDRLYNIIMKKIPSFLSLPELRFEKFMKFDELGITFHKTPMQLAPNWIAVHGDHTPLKQLGGLSALEAARRHGKNVISGHTHRAGRSAFTEASGGRIGRVLHGVEVGNLMDYKKALYGGSTGSFNWQQAFAIMYVKGPSVQVDLINIEKNGTFIVNGKVYGRPR
jgi:predicted phosphodiesterase